MYETVTQSPRQTSATRPTNLQLEVYHGMRGTQDDALTRDTHVQL